jgi:hypothetical protein
MLATNFWNIGAAVIAALALQYAELAADPRTAVFYTFLTAVALAALVLVARLHIPSRPAGWRPEAERPRPRRWWRNTAWSLRRGRKGGSR